MLRQSHRKYQKDRKKDAKNVIENFVKQNNEENSSNVLLDRLVSQDPTKHHHHRRRKIDQQHFDTITVVNISQGNSIQKAIDPVQEFEQKYCTNDPLLHYVMDVIKTKSIVTRTNILIAQKNPRNINEDESDILFLVRDPYPKCKFPNQYCLVFTAPDIIDQKVEYFTLTAKGITQFDGTFFEFTELGAWVEEKRAFDHMTMMNGLVKIERMLFFLSWKTKIIRKRHKHARFRLEVELFPCDPACRETLLQIRAVCLQLQNLSTEQIDPEKCCTIEQFAMHQHQQLSQTIVEIKNGIEKICNILYTQLITELQPLNKPTGMARIIGPAKDRFYALLRVVDCQITEAIFNRQILFLLHLHERICGKATVEKSCMPTDSFDISENHPIIEFVGCFQLQNMSKRVLITKDSKSEESEMNSVWIDSKNASFSFPSHFQLRNKMCQNPFIYFPLLHQLGTLRSIQVPTTKDSIFETFHRVLSEYMSQMDRLPRVVLDSRFVGPNVSLPFPSHHKEKWSEALEKPSHYALTIGFRYLKDLRSAIDSFYKQIEYTKHETSSLVTDMIKAENQWRKLTRDKDTMIVQSVDEYESQQKGWSCFEVRAKAMPCLFQVGFLLLDRQEIIEWAIKHTLYHMQEMEKQFPFLYRHHLLRMIQEMHERTDQITQIPTASASLSTTSGNHKTSGLTEAFSWVEHVYEMLPTQHMRQAFNKQCHDIEKFKQILQEKHLGEGILPNQPSSDIAGIAEVSNAVDEEGNVSLVDQVARLELSWECHYEALLICLSRVQEVEGEHRKSIEEILIKSEHLVIHELQSIQNDFRQHLETLSVEISEASTSPRNNAIPAIIPLSSRSARKLRQDQEIQEKIVSRLENLTEFQREMIRLQEKYALYEEEFREVYEKQNQKALHSNSSGNEKSKKKVEKESAYGTSTTAAVRTESEILLDHVVMTFHLKKWLVSWKELEYRWKQTPVIHLHPSLISSRLVQFQRKLFQAQNHLKINSVEIVSAPQNGSVNFYPNKEHVWLQEFHIRLQKIRDLQRVCLAFTIGGWKEDKWNMLVQPLISGNCTRSQLTFEMLERQWKQDVTSHQKELMMEFCDRAIEEAKIYHRIQHISSKFHALSIYTGSSSSFNDQEKGSSDLPFAFLREEETTCSGIGNGPNYGNGLVELVHPESLLFILEDLLIEIQLFFFGLNKKETEDEEDKIKGHAWLEEVQHLKRKMTEQKRIIEEIMSFQTKWHMLLNGGITRSFHPLESMFKESASNSTSSSSKLAIINSKDEILWKKFLQTCQVWHERTRRAWGLLTSSNNGSICLEDFINVFEDLRWEEFHDTCEQMYSKLMMALDSLRSTTPRLYMVDNLQLLHFLVYEDALIQDTLRTCFPSVRSFDIATKNGNRTRRGRRDSISKYMSDEHVVVLRGLQSCNAGIHCGSPDFFILPFKEQVLKIGGVSCWMEQLETQIRLLIEKNLHKALGILCKSLLPQNDTNVEKRKLRKDPLMMNENDQEQQPFHESSSEEDNENEKNHEDTHSDHSFGYLTISRLCENDGQHLQSLLSQSLMPVLNVLLDFEVKKLIKQFETGFAISRLNEVISELRHLIDQLVSKLVSSHLSTWAASLSTKKLQDLILLSNFHMSLLQKFHVLLNSNQFEEVQFLWQGQYRVQLVTESHHPVEHSTPDPRGYSLVGHIGHIQVNLGTEFVSDEQDMTLLITPVTNRCVYALLSAVIASNIVVPFGDRNRKVGKYSLLKQLSHQLMKLFLPIDGQDLQGYSFDHSIRFLDRMVEGNCHFCGWMVIRHLLKLPLQVIRTIQERLVYRKHINLVRATPSSSQLMSPGFFLMVDTRAQFRESVLVKAHKSLFIPVAVCPPSSYYLIESSLLLHGIQMSEKLLTSLENFFVSIENENIINSEDIKDVSDSFNLIQVILKICGAIVRLFKEHSHGPENVSSRRPSISSSYAGTESIAASATLAISVLETSSRSKGDHEKSSSQPNSSRFSSVKTDMDCEKMCVMAVERTFSNFFSLNTSMKEKIEYLLADYFPHVSPSRSIPFRNTARKSQVGENDMKQRVEEAVKICYESCYLVIKEPVIEKTMLLWENMGQNKSHMELTVSVIYGQAGSGKSTCITTLFTALYGLESQYRDRKKTRTTRISHLVTINPHILSSKEFFGNHNKIFDPWTSEEGPLTRFLRGSYVAGSAMKAPSTLPESHSHDQDLMMSPGVWLHIDGELRGDWVEPFLRLVDEQREYYRRFAINYETASGVSRTGAPSFLRRSAAPVHIIVECLDLSSISPQFLWKVQQLIFFSKQESVSCGDLIAKWRQQQKSSSMMRCYSSNSMTFLFTSVLFLVENVGIPYFLQEAAISSIQNKKSISTTRDRGSSKATARVRASSTTPPALLHLVSNFLNVLTRVLESSTNKKEDKNTSGTDGSMTENDENEFLIIKEKYELLFQVLFSFVWGFAGGLNGTERLRVNWLLKDRLLANPEIRYVLERGAASGGSELEANLFESKRLFSGVLSSSNDSVSDEDELDLRVDGNLIHIPVSYKPLLYICKKLICSALRIQVIKTSNDRSDNAPRLTRGKSSFLVLGEKGSGKSTFMKLLLAWKNKEESTEHEKQIQAHAKTSAAIAAVAAAKVAADTAEVKRRRLKSRRKNNLRTILNWEGMSDTLFESRTCTSSSDSEGSSVKLPLEDELYNHYRCNESKGEHKSFVFLEDLNLSSNSGDSIHKVENGEDRRFNMQYEFLRFLLDHGLVFNRRTQKFMTVKSELMATAGLPRAIDQNVQELDQQEEESGTTFGLVRFLSSATSTSSCRVLRHLILFRINSMTTSELHTVFETKYRNQLHHHDIIFNKDTAHTVVVEEEDTSSNVSLKSLKQVHEMVFKASMELGKEAFEISFVRNGMTFNLHHIGELLQKTLDFGNKLYQHQNENPDALTSAFNFFENIYECWVFQAKKIYLDQAKNLHQPNSHEVATVSKSQPPHSVDQKLFGVLRSCSEKFFALGNPIKNEESLWMLCMNYMLKHSSFITSNHPQYSAPTSVVNQQEQGNTQNAASSALGSRSSLAFSKTAFQQVKQLFFTVKSSIRESLRSNNLTRSFACCTLDKELYILLGCRACFDHVLSFVTLLQQNRTVQNDGNHEAPTESTGTNEGPNGSGRYPTIYPGRHVYVTSPHKVLTSKLVQIAAQYSGFTAKILSQAMASSINETILSSGCWMQKTLAHVLIDSGLQGQNTVLYIDLEDHINSATCADNVSKVLTGFLSDLAHNKIWSCLHTNMALRDLIITKIVRKLESYQTEEEVLQLFMRQVQAHLSVFVLTANPEPNHLNTTIASSEAFHRHVISSFPIDTVQDISFETASLLSGGNTGGEAGSKISSGSSLLASGAPMGQILFQTHQRILEKLNLPPCHHETLGLDMAVRFFTCILRLWNRKQMIHVRKFRDDFQLHSFLTSQKQRLVQLQSEEAHVGARIKQLVIEKDVKRQLYLQEKQVFQWQQQHQQHNVAVIPLVTQESILWCLRNDYEQATMEQEELQEKWNVLCTRIQNLSQLIDMASQLVRDNTENLQMEENSRDKQLLAVVLDSLEICYCGHVPSETVDDWKNWTIQQFLSSSSSKNPSLSCSLSHETEHALVLRVWQAKYPFLKSKTIHRKILTVDFDLGPINRLPVFVDTTGLVQEFLIDCLGAKQEDASSSDFWLEEENKDPNQKQSLSSPTKSKSQHKSDERRNKNQCSCWLLSCDDPELAKKLSVAQKHNFTVLLVDFKSSAISTIASFIKDQPTRKPLLIQRTLKQLFLREQQAHQLTLEQQRSHQLQKQGISGGKEGIASVINFATGALAKVQRTKKNHGLTKRIGSKATLLQQQRDSPQHNEGEEFTRTRARSNWKSLGTMGMKKSIALKEKKRQIPIEKNVERLESTVLQRHFQIYAISSSSSSCPWSPTTFSSSSDENHTFTDIFSLLNVVEMDWSVDILKNLFSDLWAQKWSLTFVEGQLKKCHQRMNRLQAGILYHQNNLLESLDCDDENAHELSIEPLSAIQMKKREIQQEEHACQQLEKMKKQVMDEQDEKEAKTVVQELIRLSCCLLSFRRIVPTHYQTLAWMCSWMDHELESLRNYMRSKSKPKDQFQLLQEDKDDDISDTLEEMGDVTADEDDAERLQLGNRAKPTTTSSKDLLEQKATGQVICERLLARILQNIPSNLRSVFLMCFLAGSLDEKLKDSCKSSGVIYPTPESRSVIFNFVRFLGGDISFLAKPTSRDSTWVKLKAKIERILFEETTSCTKLVEESEDSSSDSDSPEETSKNGQQDSDDDDGGKESDEVQELRSIQEADTNYSDDKRNKRSSSIVSRFRSTVRTWSVFNRRGSVDSTQMDRDFQNLFAAMEKLQALSEQTSYSLHHPTSWKLLELLLADSLVSKTVVKNILRVFKPMITKDQPYRCHVSLTMKELEAHVGRQVDDTSMLSIGKKDLQLRLDFCILATLKVLGLDQLFISHWEEILRKNWSQILEEAFESVPAGAVNIPRGILMGLNEDGMPSSTINATFDKKKSRISRAKSIQLQGRCPIQLPTLLIYESIGEEESNESERIEIHAYWSIYTMSPPSQGKDSLFCRQIGDQIIELLRNPPQNKEFLSIAIEFFDASLCDPIIVEISSLIGKYWRQTTSMHEKEKKPNLEWYLITSQAVADQLKSVHEPHIRRDTIISPKYDIHRSNTRNESIVYVKKRYSVNSREKKEEPVPTLTTWHALEETLYWFHRQASRSFSVVCDDDACFEGLEMSRDICHTLDALRQWKHQLEDQQHHHTHRPSFDMKKVSEEFLPTEKKQLEWILGTGVYGSKFSTNEGLQRELQRLFQSMWLRYQHQLRTYHVTQDDKMIEQGLHEEVERSTTNATMRRSRLYMSQQMLMGLEKLCLGLQHNQQGDSAFTNTSLTRYFHPHALDMPLTYKREKNAMISSVKLIFEHIKSMYSLLKGIFAQHTLESNHNAAVVFDTGMNGPANVSNNAASVQKPPLITCTNLYYVPWIELKQQVEWNHLEFKRIYDLFKSTHDSSSLSPLQNWIPLEWIGAFQAKTVFFDTRINLFQCLLMLERKISFTVQCMSTISRPSALQMAHVSEVTQFLDQMRQYYAAKYHVNESQLELVLEEEHPLVRQSAESDPSKTVKHDTQQVSQQSEQQQEQQRHGLLVLDGNNVPCGVYVEGLYLGDVSWNTSSLSVQNQFYELPTCRLYFHIQKNVHDKDLAQVATRLMGKDSTGTTHTQTAFRKAVLRAKAVSNATNGTIEEDTFMRHLPLVMVPTVPSIVCEPDDLLSRHHTSLQKATSLSTSELSVSLHGPRNSALCQLVLQHESKNYHESESSTIPTGLAILVPLLSPTTQVNFS